MMGDLGTKSEKFAEYIVEHRINELGEHTVYRFANGYGASVEGGIFTHGLELAIIEFNDDENMEITYKTPITDDFIGDVIGFLTLDELDEILGKIKELEHG